jgi:phage shock protein C
MRSSNNKMIAGVCGGLADYLNLDPTVVRLIFMLLFFLGGHGLLVYLILWLVMPAQVVEQL